MSAFNMKLRFAMRRILLILVFTARFQIFRARSAVLERCDLRVCFPGRNCLVGRLSRPCEFRLIRCPNVLSRCFRGQTPARASRPFVPRRTAVAPILRSPSRSWPTRQRWLILAVEESHRTLNEWEAPSHGVALR